MADAPFCDVQALEWRDGILAPCRHRIHPPSRFFWAGNASFVGSCSQDEAGVLCQPQGSVPAGIPALLEGRWIHLPAAIAAGTLWGAQGCTGITKPHGITHARTPQHLDLAPPVAFPQLWSSEGSSTPHARLPWFSPLLLRNRNPFGVHEEKPEERILDFSRTWGSPEGVQGHGGSLPTACGSILGKHSGKKIQFLAGIFGFASFQSTPPLPSRPEQLSFT